MPGRNSVTDEVTVKNLLIDSDSCIPVNYEVREELLFFREASKKMHTKMK